MAERDAIQDLPAITKETLNSAINTLRSQYADDHSKNYSLPQAVYLNQLPSYNDFFVNYLVTNQLCVLSEEATRHWRSRNEWVCQDGSPNFDFLQEAFGDATVPVANCKQREFNAHSMQEMKMSEFLSYWRRHREAKHPSGDDSLYLKDWHFTRAFPDYKAYSTCPFFTSDWMNEFWDVREDIADDYRFVYMGPKGTWTAFHTDVFRSFSWSASICGRKRWIFFPPGEEEHLKDCHNNLMYDLTTKGLEDPQKYPNAHKVQHRIEIIQHPGETIFVPSGWHHQVENLEDTISINHNWLNGSNVRLCWAHLKASLVDVECQISDFRDMDGWEHQCQKILRAYTGLNYAEFFRFMSSVAQRRIQALDAWKKRADAASNPFCCTGIAVSQSSPSQTQVEKETDVRGKNDSCSETHEKNKSSSEESTVHSELKTRTETRETANYPSSAGKDQGERGGSYSFEEQILVCNKTRLQDLSHSSVDEIRIPLKHTHVSSQSDHAEETTRSTLLHPSGTLCSSDGDTQEQDNVLCDTCQSERELSRVMLDLWDDAGNAAPKQRPFWSRCNVHHALFDLVSVGMVLQDMKSASLDVLKEDIQPQEDEGKDGSEPAENEPGRIEGKKDLDPELLFGKIRDALSEFGVRENWSSH